MHARKDCSNKKTHLHISGSSAATDVVMMEANSLKIQLILRLDISRKKMNHGNHKLRLPSLLKVCEFLQFCQCYCNTDLIITRSDSHRVCYDLYWLSQQEYTHAQHSLAAVIIILLCHCIIYSHTRGSQSQDQRLIWQHKRVGFYSMGNAGCVSESLYLNSERRPCQEQQ